MYAANATHRFLDKLGMTERRNVVIPNAVRDLYMAISAYLVMCEQCDKSQFVEVYAACVSHRSLAPLGMTERRIVVIPNAVRDLYIAIPAYIALRIRPHNPQFAGRHCHKTARCGPSII